MPAQVPSTGVPERTSSRSGSASPSRSMPSVIVVDSPPGITSPSSPSRSAGTRTSRTSAPRPRSISACASKSPWSASTPTSTRIRFPMRVLAARSPAAVGEELLVLELARLQRRHRLAEALGGARDAVGVAEVRRRFDDRRGARRGVLGLEDARADEDALGAELHDERGVRRGRDAAGAEQHDRQLAGGGDSAHEVERRLELLGGGRQLHVVERLEAPDLRADPAQVAHGLDDVAGAGLALGADHRRALADPPQRLAEAGGAADERHLEGPLVDVVGLVRGREHLGLVDVVDLERLQHLGLGEVADAGLRHHRDRDGLMDPADQQRVGHARDAAVAADVGRDALERHDRGGSGVLRSEEHTSELQSRQYLVCRLLLEKKKKKTIHLFFYKKKKIKKNKYIT